MLMNIILLTVLEGEVREGQGVRGDVCIQEESEARRDGIRDIYIQAFISINITIATHSIDLFFLLLW